MTLFQVSIVCDYLASQHRLCKNPMATCPEFDLLVPHKCPDPRPKNSSPWNITSRLTRRSVFPPFGGPGGLKLDRKLVYSRFRPMRSIRTESANSGTFTSCALMPDDSHVLAGTYSGELKMFGLGGDQTEEASYNCHESTLYHLQPSRDSSMLLTSSAWRTPYSCLWSMGQWFEQKMAFREDEYVEFSKLKQDMVSIAVIDRDS